LRRKEIIEVEVAEDALKDIPALEKAYKAKFIQACVREGKATVKMLYPVERLDSEDIYVNVWDCQATLCVGEKTEEDFSLTQEQKDALEKLKEYVIYTENGGAINWSGQYFLSDYSVGLLKAILEGRVDAVSEIEPPTDEDYKIKAKQILNLLKAGEIKAVEVYNSIIRCYEGCQGYHVHQWLTYEQGQLIFHRSGAHHAGYGDWWGEKAEPITESKALDEIAEWLSQLAKKWDWTKRELLEAEEDLDISEVFELNT
jgi:hypothetical protein